MNQFAYPQSQGPGPYGWNPGYGGSPFNYSNFQNSLVQGMMGGGYGWPEQNMGGYGGGMMPQMQDLYQGMMGGMGYGDPYGGMGFDPNMMGQVMMGYY